MTVTPDLVIQRPEGLYCPAGDFYIDPWRPVARAVITHAHADHARIGHGHYLAASPGETVLRARLGDVRLQTLAYGERVVHHGVTVSLHPAGHVLGSAQVRLEHGGQVWVASGDYKVVPDATCAPFEPVPLYGVLGRRGFTHWAESGTPGDWSIWFYRGDAAGAPAPSGITAAPREQLIDVRGLEAPQPMVQVLARLDAIGPGDTLVVLHDRRPLFLYPQLDDRGFVHETDEPEPNLVRIRIRRAAP